MRAITGGFLIAIALSAAACQPREVRAAKAAEQRYRLIEKSGTLDEACVTAREVRDAYLAALDNQNYKLWSATSDIQCMAARQEGGYLPADLKARQEIQQKAIDAELDASAAAAEAASNEALESVSPPDPTYDQRDACLENATTTEEHQACNHGQPVDE